MYGAMVWCCLRSGRLGKSHFQSSLTSKYWNYSKLATANPLLLDVQELSTNWWWIAGKIQKFNMVYCAANLIIIHSGIQSIIKDLLLKRFVIISNCHWPSYSIGVQILMGRPTYWGQHWIQPHSCIWICKITTNSSNEHWIVMAHTESTTVLCQSLLCLHILILY